jgi:hypothetical protein
MSVTKEFTIRLEDRPGTLGKLCQALADQNVKILAFQSFPLEKGKCSVQLVLDFPPLAKTILDDQRADYTETKVAQVKLIHRPGELARVATRRSGNQHRLRVLRSGAWHQCNVPDLRGRGGG